LERRETMKKLKRKLKRYPTNPNAPTENPKMELMPNLPTLQTIL
jgi:hypothetical protein